MSEIKNGGPAAPVFIVAGGVDPAEIAKQLRDAKMTGVSVRDYFAANSGVTWQDALVVVNRSGEKATTRLVTDTLAAMRLAVADAMLLARES